MDETESRLLPIPTKTEAICFRLNNKLPNKELEVCFNNHLPSHSITPKYFEVIVDRIFRYKQHLTKAAAKLRTHTPKFEYMQVLNYLRNNKTT